KDGVVYAKPVDDADAICTLSSFSGRSHVVYTGVAIITPTATHTFYEATQVNFKQLSAQQIQAYVATGSPMDKAGSYGIQDCGFVHSIVGSYDNVVGFPTGAVKQVLSNYVKTKDYQEKNYG
ncbi:MAG: Maf family protein, partial [Clostridia bacterium]|nr:Maf family protein [Clostridia bacterium]